MQISEYSVKIIDGVEHRNIVPKYVLLDTPEEYHELEEELFGMCTVCGTEHYGVEHDASGYICDACSSPSVKGVTNLLLSGRIA
jgi:rubrerythrin